MRLSLRSLSLLCVLLLAGCGGGGGGGGGGSGRGGQVSPPTSTPAGDNVQPITVNGGPAGIVNLAYTSVTVCAPGTEQCRTIDNIIVDTGSVGLRLVPAALDTLALPAQYADSGSPLFECIEFVDLSHAWGSVRRADVRIAGLTAAYIPVQVIGDAGTPPEPASCGGGDSALNLSTVESMGGNGILGVGFYREDCGLYCTYIANNDYYFSCDNASCAPTLAAVDIQLQNPVALFPSDNNGVIVQLPALASDGAASVGGWMIFGIDTRDNNQLGRATVHRVNGGGYFTTRYKNIDYAQSFVDSGSNGLFFPDNTIRRCSWSDMFFCPPSTLNLTATIRGLNNNSSTIDFSIANADTLSGYRFAFDNLGGFYSRGFDWGLPFFYGRRVYTALETHPDGPYVAF